VVNRRPLAPEQWQDQQRQQAAGTQAATEAPKAAPAPVAHKEKPVAPAPPAAPVAPVPTAPVSRSSSPARALLSHSQALGFRRLWGYLVDVGPGSDPDARLLALVIALRALREGRSNVVARDIRGLRLADPAAALVGLITTGWMEAIVAVVLVAETTNPASCTVPTLTDNPLKVGEQVRSRMSGWMSKVTSHKKLRKLPPDGRLAALYLTSYALPTGEIEVEAADMAAGCAMAGAGQAAKAANALREAGWLAECQLVDGRVRAKMAEEMLSFAPAPDPSLPVPRPARAKSRTRTFSKATVSAQAGELIAGRESEIAAWVETYRDKHGHGPAWSVLANGQNWDMSWSRRHVATDAINRLLQQRWLSGRNEPYGLRPGSRYLEPAEPSADE
jgi:hypothetical protein